MVIAPNGTLVGEPGYARGNYMRSTPGFGDPTMVNLLPPDGRAMNQILPSDLMCKSTQTSQTQSNGSPRLQAAAGDAVALRFQENGHVTLPDNQPGKPSNRGTVYVYGTTQPSPDDSFLAIHRVWTPDGTGGDGRGQLLSTRNFDDGQCYQTNGGQLSQQRQQQFGHPFDMLMGNDLWCQQDIQLPSDLQSGKPYTLYWVWDWPTMPGTPGFPQGKQEIYTTCMDVDIVADSGIVPVSKAQVSYVQGQPLDNAAVQEQMSDLANPTAVTGQTIPFSGAPTPTTMATQVKTTSVSQQLTSTPGSTIAFSASATGPVKGGASEASVSAATASETGIPAFLSVHTGSTAGPGIETQTFTVLPISAGANGESPDGYPDISASDMATASGPQVTGAPNAAGNAQQVATLTQYESVYETVLTTLYVTQYTKRDAGESYPTSGPIPAPAQVPHSGWPMFNHTRPGSNHTGTRFNRTHSGGPPPWATIRPGAAWPSGRPSNWTGSHEWNNTGKHSGRHSHTTTVMVQSIITVQNTMTLTTLMPSAMSPAASDSATSTSTFTVTMTLPVPPIDGSLSPSSTNSSPPASPTEVQPLTISPIPAPEPTSTNHAAFRLRARNPFVMLGWMHDAEPTPSSSS
jgi:hypothetical protein